jgi:hypothetical protein
MTVIEIEPDVITKPDPVEPEPYDPDTDEFPDIQENPEPEWNV